MEFANGYVLDDTGGDYNRLGRRREKVVEAQTREATSAQQQQSRGGFSGRSSALRPPRGCSRAPSVRFLKTAVAVLFFLAENQFSKPIFKTNFHNGFLEINQKLTRKPASEQQKPKPKPRQKLARNWGWVLLPVLKTSS